MDDPDMDDPDMDDPDMDDPDRAPASVAARMLAVVRAIPRGQVAGYGDVARRAGFAGRARLAARVLSTNTDADLPWHRVVRSDGRIAFPAGSEGFAEQCRRLRADGVAVNNGRVRMQKREFDLDAEVWGMG